MKVLDIKAGITPNNAKCLKLLTSNLQTQFEGIKEVSIKDEQLIISFTSAEFAEYFNHYLDKNKIQTNLENNSISIPGKHINQFIDFQLTNQSNCYKFFTHAKKYAVPVGIGIAGAAVVAALVYAKKGHGPQ